MLNGNEANNNKNSSNVIYDLIKDNDRENQKHDPSPILDNTTNKYSWEEVQAILMPIDDPSLIGQKRSATYAMDIYT